MLFAAMDALDREPLESLKRKLDDALAGKFLATPAMLEAVEGREGAVVIPPEQWWIALQGALSVLVTQVPNIAGAVDVTRVQVQQLIERVEAVERRLDERG